MTAMKDGDTLVVEMSASACSEVRTRVTYDPRVDAWLLDVVDENPAVVFEVQLTQ